MVTTGGFRGVVENIGIKSTTIRALNGEVLVVCNKEVACKPVTKHPSQCDRYGTEKTEGVLEGAEGSTMANHSVLVAVAVSLYRTMFIRLKVNSSKAPINKLTSLPSTLSMAITTALKHDWPTVTVGLIALDDVTPLAYEYLIPVTVPASKLGDFRSVKQKVWITLLESLQQENLELAKSSCACTTTTQ